jgi:hypothetical protein
MTTLWFFKYFIKKKTVEAMAQVIERHSSKCNCKALSSNTSIIQKKKNQKNNLELLSGGELEFLY